MLGVLATYWYLTQRPYTQTLVSSWWEEASSPPPARAKPAERAR
jgi:hypothetical protein